jgi:arginine decarboxylase
LADNQFRTPLFDAMKKYAADGVVPFHVPGHKQGHGLPEFGAYFGENILKTDVNGMDDMDYYNNPSGVILEAEKLMAEAYGAAHSFFLVNGTTSGVQTMILAACGPGKKIILPRNAHKSTVSGLVLSGAVPVYVQPEFHPELGIAMGMTNAAVQQAIRDNPDASAVFVINPTYYGMTSDIKTIAGLAKDAGMAVLADEAHGAPLPFHPGLPVSAMSAGADMSAASIHKTGGSLTQSSGLFVGPNFSPEKVRQALNLLSTSSASYILMGSLDIARKQLATRGEEMLEEALELARWARAEINSIDGLWAFGRELAGTPGCFDFDETKLGIYVAGIGYTGYELERVLRRQYGIQIELSDMRNILAVVTLGDSRGNLGRLVDALKDIVRKGGKPKAAGDIAFSVTPEIAMTPREAFFSPKKIVRLEQSVGEVAGAMIMAYPPGIPVLGIGERITKDIVDYIVLLKQQECQLQGAADPASDTISVIAS